ncbi:P-type conjugative transfer protein TrbJ [Sphingobium sp. B11D3B]|uniref:P-type conjugative transfer protein TrbJ n=1 Tax=Sphingobium sp. B11D3B TaxID=2940575 RepID=UPI002225D447|nr:P-type conjugative transfer protein TrbJ [Sphingobium sp. B11D3B]MCW2387166.1 P-type conjugative transfer protein TrbJ [Sphingobium sp. B11D3B]
MKNSAIRRALLTSALVSMLGGSVTVVAPAQAQFGGIVYDPTNYASNVLQAARALQQVNNQIKQIQQAATSLINEAKNLASLPVSALSTLQAQVDHTRQLLGQAQRIAYDVQSIQGAFEGRYKGTALTGPHTQMVANAKARWEDSVGALEDTLRVQAGVVGNLGGTRGAIDTLVGASQSASGALQAAQAGNQLLALQSQQLADLTAAIAAQGRAQALDAAGRAAIEAEARERFRRFRGKN